MNHQTKVHLIDDPNDSDVTYLFVKRLGIEYNTYETKASIPVDNADQTHKLRVEPDTGFLFAACNSPIVVTETHLEIEWSKETILLTEHQDTTRGHWVCELFVNFEQLSL